MKCCIKQCNGEGGHPEWLPQFQAVAEFCDYHFGELEKGKVRLEHIDPFIKEEHNKTMDILEGVVNETKG